MYLSLRLAVVYTLLSVTSRQDLNGSLGYNVLSKMASLWDLAMFEESFHTFSSTEATQPPEIYVNNLCGDETSPPHYGHILNPDPIWLKESLN